MAANSRRLTSERVVRLAGEQRGMAGVFPAFYKAMAEAFAAIGGEAWTPTMQAAWDELTAEVEQIVQAPAQTI